MPVEGVPAAPKIQPLFGQEVNNPVSKFSQYGATLHANTQEASSQVADAS